MRSLILIIIYQVLIFHLVQGQSQEMGKPNLDLIKKNAICIIYFDYLKENGIDDYGLLACLPEFTKFYDIQVLNSSKGFDNIVFLKIQRHRRELTLSEQTSCIEIGRQLKRLSYYSYYIAYDMITHRYFILDGTEETDFPEFIDFLYRKSNTRGATEKVFASRRSFKKFYSVFFQVDEIDFNRLTNLYLFFHPTPNYFLPRIRKSIPLQRKKSDLSRFFRLFALRGCLWRSPKKRNKNS